MPDILNGCWTCRDDFAVTAPARAVGIIFGAGVFGLTRTATTSAAASREMRGHPG